ncbi:hypothetical protein PS15m_012023 [Mucor circinelloides]
MFVSDDIAKTRKAEWLTITFAVIDELVNGVFDFQLGRSSASVSSKPTSASDSSAGRSSKSISQSSSVDSSDQDITDLPLCKIPKLSSVDKENIRLLYDRLNSNKMWHLSTGKIVEETMREIALTVEHEPSCHSLILDINDTCWVDVFNKKERDEIRAFGSVNMPVMSVEVESYVACYKPDQQTTAFVPYFFAPSPIHPFLLQLHANPFHLEENKLNASPHSADCSSNLFADYSISFNIKHQI